MSDAVALDVAGSRLLLLAGKALYWPDGRMLCVADAHFGKDAAYRALGQPVPDGSTVANLARLDALIARHDPVELVFLGDFLHARKSRTPVMLDALRAWRVRHAALTCRLVRGNHDRHAGDPPADAGIAVVDEPYVRGPLALRHTPAPHPRLHVLAGHVHPVFMLRGRGRQRLRLPCFVSDAAMTVLPAFGDFTGGYQVGVGADSRVFVTDGTDIWPVSTG